MGSPLSSIMGSVFGKEEKEERSLESKLEQLRFELDLDVHYVPVDDLCRRWNTNVETGLTFAQAQNNLEEWGLNELSPPYSPPEWVKLCKNLFSGFNKLPLLGAAPFYIAYGMKYSAFDQPPAHFLYVGVALTAVGVASGVHSYYKEAKYLNAIKDTLPVYALVRREGQKVTMKARELAMGDIVEIRYGDTIPADIRILDTQEDLKVDNYVITGESEPQARSKEYIPGDALEANNLAFFTTKAVEGRAVGMVVNIGDNTAIGRLASM